MEVDVKKDEEEIFGELEIGGSVSINKCLFANQDLPDF